MRKIVYYIHSSLDGYVQGEHDWDINFLTYDDELAQYSHELIHSGNFDTVLWGRSTYLGMQNHWTTIPSNPEATSNEKIHADWLNNTTKVVFSTTLDQLDWQNSRLIKENVAEEIRKLKEEPGKDMIVIGSPRLAQTLMKHDLIDRYIITVHPIILGSGLPLFPEQSNRTKLKLAESKTLQSGVLALAYDAVR